MSNIEFNLQLPLVVERLAPYAIKLTRSRDAAMDLCQETCCRALINRDKFSAGTSLEAWLLVIMRNIFLNNYRRQVLYEKYESASRNRNLQEEDSNLSYFHPESVMMLKELEEGMDILPGKFRQTFRLYYEGYKYHEIAESLNEPMGTIKSRIHTAKRMLKHRAPDWVHA